HVHAGLRADEQRWLEEAPASLDLRGASAREHFGASGDGLLDLARNRLRRPGLGHWAHRSPLRRRIAEAVRAHEREGRVDEAVVEAPVHVDPLDSAAALAGVVAGAVDEAVCGLLEIGVFGDVRRVFAAELEADVDEAFRCSRSVDAMAAF